MLKSLFISFLRIINCIKWHIEYFFIKVTFNKKTKAQSLSIKNNEINVILVPHADDELIGAYQLTFSNICNTKLLFFEMTGSNDDIENKAIRTNEFLNYCDRNSLNCVLLNKDSFLFDYIPNTKHINLFFPSCVDWHHEHRIISEFVKKSICDRCEKVSFYWYSITIPIVSKRTIFIEENKENLKKKYDEFRCVYKSQSHLPIIRFVLQERINGMNINKYGAENYIEISFDELCKSIDYVHKHEEELNCLKKCINNIRKIRKKSKEIYDKLL